MKIFISLIIAINLFALCPNNQALSDPKLKQKTTEICFDEFGVLFSTTHNIPLATYEYLTKERIQKALVIKRKNAFHEEIPYTPKPFHYKHSGYDRGHMAPANDMSSYESQYQSFSMVNIIPQVHGNNAGAWKKLEEYVRGLALSNTDVYVVSGVIIYGNEPKLKNIITIPKVIYKGVYIPKNRSVKIYIIENTDNPITKVMTEQEFRTKYGIDLFPKKI